MQGAFLGRRASSDAAATPAAASLPLSRGASLPYQPQLGTASCAGSGGAYREGSPPGRQSSQGLPPSASLPHSSSDPARSKGEAHLLVSPDQRRSSASDAAGGFPALGDTRGAGAGSSGRSPPGQNSSGGKLKRSASEGGATLLAADSEQQLGLEQEQEQDPPLAPAPTEKLEKDDVLR